MLLFVTCSAFINFNRMPVNLYYFDNNSYYNKLSECKTIFRRGSTVYLDDECFYWQYVLSTRYPAQGLRIMLNEPTYNRQDYCIMPAGSKPPSDTTLYRVKESIDGYTIFEKIK
jgi:hypothetical protein